LSDQKNAAFALGPPPEPSGSTPAITLDR
jgi:hypothetical protein